MKTSAEILPFEKRLDKWQKLQLEGFVKNALPLANTNVSDLLLQYDKALETAEFNLVDLENKLAVSQELEPEAFPNERLAYHLYKALVPRIGGLVTLNELEDLVEQFTETL